MTSQSGGKKNVKHSLKHQYQKILLIKTILSKKLTFLCDNFIPFFSKFSKFSNLRPLLFATFPQGFQVSKIFGYPTLGSGDKKLFKQYLKSEQTHRQTDRHTHTCMDKLTRHRPRGSMLYIYIYIF